MSIDEGCKWHKVVRSLLQTQEHTENKKKRNITFPKHTTSSL